MLGRYSEPLQRTSVSPEESQPLTVPQLGSQQGGMSDCHQNTCMHTCTHTCTCTHTHAHTHAHTHMHMHTHTHTCTCTHAHAHAHSLPPVLFHHISMHPEQSHSPSARTRSSPTAAPLHHTMSHLRQPRQTCQASCSRPPTVGQCNDVMHPFTHITATVTVLQYVMVRDMFVTINMLCITHCLVPCTNNHTLLVNNNTSHLRSHGRQIVHCCPWQQVVRTDD